MSDRTPDVDPSMMERALRLLEVPPDQTANAIRWITEVVEDFRERSSAKRLSLKELKEILDRISRSARGLQRLLDETWPTCRTAAVAYTTLEDWQEGQSFTYLEQVLRNPERVQLTLDQLATTADRIASKVPAPRGRNRSATERFSGLPKQVLALTCWELFHHFQPGKATGTEGGPYHELTCVVYEMATGQPADDVKGPGLERYVKSTAVFCRAFL